MTTKAFGATALTGGGTGAVDRSEVDGANLNNLDLMLCNTTQILYPYWLDSDSGAAEDSPRKIAPDTNPGTKRWVLQSMHLQGLTLEDALPITQGGTGATTAAGARTNLGAAASGVNTDISSLDLGGTTLLASRQITVDTGGGLDINMGTASGDDFTIDTSAFVVEGDTGRVGIGTATPGSRFHIKSPGATEVWLTSAQYNITSFVFFDAVDGEEGSIEYDHNTNRIYFNTNASSSHEVTILSNGNVGIGTITFGTSAAGELALGQGTLGDPAANISQLVVEDLSTGVAVLRIQNEVGLPGTVGNVTTKATTGNGTGYEGLFEINTFDNSFSVYAEGAWRSLATW